MPKQKVLLILENDYIFYPKFLSTLCKMNKKFIFSVWIVSAPKNKNRSLQILKKILLFPILEIIRAVRFFLLLFLYNIKNRCFSIKQVANRFSIESTMIYGNINTKNILLIFDKINPDIVFSASSQFIGQDLLARRSKFINIHFSLLPKYKGFMPLFYAKLHNEKYSGISFHEMTSVIDEGQIYHQKKILLNKDDPLIFNYKYFFENSPLELFKCIDIFNSKKAKRAKRKKERKNINSYFTIPNKDDLKLFFKHNNKFF